MTVYYVDPAASGDDDGGGDGVDRTDPTEAANWTNAWEDIVSADNNVSAGDIIYCRGTQILSDPITWDTATGDLVTGPIHIIGCDGSGNPRQGQFTLDANEAASACLAVVSGSYIIIENFTFIDSTTHNVSVASNYCSYWVFKHCISSSATNSGWYLLRMLLGLLINCIADGNGATGFDAITPTTQGIGCTAKNNGDYGFNLSAGNLCCFYGCLAYDNTDDGFYLDSSNHTIVNCVSDGNNVGLSGGSGLKIDGGLNHTIWACRFTNNDVYGIEMASTINDSNIEDYCVFDNNDNGPRLNIVAGLNSDASPADDGYVNASTDDYNIKTGAEIRNTSMDIDWN